MSATPALYKPPALFEEKSASSARDFVDGLWQEAEPWRTRVAAMSDLYASRHEIPWPKQLPVTPTNYYTGLPLQQTRLVLGMLMGEMPQASLQTPLRDAKKAKAVESLEAAGNLLWPRLEQQAREVWAPTTEAKLVYGLGWSFFSDRPSVLAQAPLRTATDKSGKALYRSGKAHQEGRQDYLRSLGMPGGRLPFQWRHVPTPDVLWSESDDGMDVVIEFREVKALDVLNNPAFGEALPVLRTRIERLVGRGAKGVSQATVQLCHIETPDRVTILSGMRQGYGSSVSEAQEDLWTSYTTPEIAWSGPNKVGQIRYVPDHGLIGSSRSQWDRYRGIFQDMSGLILRLDTYKSYLMYDHQMHLFAPIVLQPTEGPNPNQAVMPLSKDAKPPTLSIEVGYHKVAIPPPGYQFSYLTKPSNPEFMALLAEIRRDCMLLGVPDTILDTQGVSSGYMLNQLLGTVLASMKTVLAGTRLSWQQMHQLLHATLRVQNETIPLQQQTEDGTRWVNLDAEVLQDPSLPITIDVIYEIKKTADDAAALQNYGTAVATGAMHEDLARETFLYLTNHEEIRAHKLVDNLQKSQPWLDSLTNDAITEMGLADKEAQAKEQAAMDLESLLAATPAMADLLAQEAPAGAPGFGPAQQYMALRQQSGGMPQGNPPQQALPPGQGEAAPQPEQNPNVAPLPGGVPGGQMGTAAGQGGGLPGGPQMTGGL